MKKSEEIKITILQKWMSLYFEENLKDGDALLCYLCQCYSCSECDRCPIKIETGKKECIGTPFRKYYNKPTRANAREMVLFLIKLFRKNKRLEASK
ncbi:MAG: hypothetical protein NUV76_12320 [Candidatus Kuenenia sp.]|nr:hypothetical protein [Candidatus Kuenenia sp.]